MPSAEKNKKILVICPHPEGYVPGQRLKYEQYFEHWRQNGFDVEVSSFMSESMQKIVYKKGFLFPKLAGTIYGYYNRINDIFRVSSYDVVYVFLWVTPFGLPFSEWLIHKCSKKIIYDIDDLVFLKNIKHENKILSYLKGKNKPLFMMKKANHVIACTPYLENIAKKYNKNVTDISSTINTEAYLPLNSYSNNDEIIIGWSGSHSTSQYLKLLSKVLIELRKKVKFKLLVIGDEHFEMEGLQAEVYPWTASNEIALLQKIDIGVYPLPLNEEWVLGKSGLKALQYMALGIPTIATDVGCNNRVITNGIDGFLVSTEFEWAEKLEYLIANPLARQAIGKKAREKVLTRFSVNVNQSKYLEILENVSNC